jgi:FixJ family two-component response regulator
MDICRCLKAKKIPKTFRCSYASPQIAFQAKAVCADSFLEKPFKMQALREAAGKLIV